MPHSLVLQLSKRDLITANEQQVLLNAFGRQLRFKAGAEIVADGSRPMTSLILSEGIVGRAKILANGTRQISALHVPGDFLDLHGFLLKTMAHGVVALTDCLISVVDHAVLKNITETAPHLSRMLWLNTLIDGSIHREWIVRMGRMSATAQVAHLVCEMFVRLEIVNRTVGRTFTFPLSQIVLADILGLSTVHANRSIQELRRSGAITWQNSRIEISDWTMLVDIAEFDSTYLCLDFEPR
ncbi:Crp/Fnr family transcriptional regulator [Aminobacter carboxidus]|uniref:CRP-like cAMP-binding protein n=1 Tax=Aminobacter carboxidus TaxID=376165 RepID=A0A8E1WK08_9HYPH|nr:MULTISPECIES: Crp/Fnr family transcriptional regulator [Aminobacter carboxidus group]MBB6468761.1 CRP-like cAMP-binding protein [Aminobacter lissarensis]MBE1206257.1 Crp/Fnr family transcriptional regulator [Aminobacter carboxidus]